MLHEMTAAHLRNAYGGESMAHMRYAIWGTLAERDNFPNVARLFRAISHAELVHASNHFSVHRNLSGAFIANSGGIFGSGTTSKNLQGGIDGETFEIEEMYPVYLNVAQFQNEKGAELSFHYALSAEKIHAAMFRKAKQAVDEGRDVVVAQVGICENCGHTVEGQPPDKCPICNAGKERYKIFG